ncbi:hypothetical protein H1C71_039310, partial [Ictidomys tridecemlineatus]
WPISSRNAFHAARRSASLRRRCACWRKYSISRQPQAVTKMMASPSSSAPSSAAAPSFSGFTASALKPMMRILVRISAQWYTARERGWGVSQRDAPCQPLPSKSRLHLRDQNRWAGFGELMP